MSKHPSRQHAASPTPPQRLGRFELRHQLGQGAQAAVWLAHDPRLQRDVALKLFHGGQDPSDQRWLQEARHIGRMIHPGIVTLYEADLYEGMPALALEYVQGPTLAQKLHADGALTETQAVQWMIDVLDALHHAHKAGLVHRDLKPSNLLLDPEGRIKVTDFGIASPVRPANSGPVEGLEGTPYYVSPEAIRGEAPRPVNDVFSAALVLAEMLTGTRLLGGGSPQQALQRIAQEDLALPVDLQHPIDDALRSIVQRALARQPEQRYADAAAFATALREWQAARQAAANAPGATNTSVTLEFLLRRMRRSSDFPAMSEQMVRVQRVANSDHERHDSLTNEILKDVALTNKLLRIVNSAGYSHVGAGSISTVSRAVSLLGFAGIRNLAMSLVLLDHMENKAHANQLKSEYLRGLLSGALAAELVQGLRGTEEVFLGAMFQNLGRLLTEFYLPDEARQIRELCGNARQNEEAAAESVLGISFEALAQGVGKAWGLPDAMVRLMRRPSGIPPRTLPRHLDEQLHWAAVAANAMAAVFLEHEPASWAEQLRLTAQTYATAVGKDSEQMVRSAQHAREQLLDTALAIGLRVTPNSSAARLLLPPTLAPATGTDALEPLRLRANAQSPAMDDAPTERVSRAVLDGGIAPPQDDTERANRTTAMLTLGVQDVAQALTESYKLQDVLRMVLESMYRALGCRQAIFVLKDARTGILQGRFGLGGPATDTVKLFRFELREQNNVFSAVCRKGVDALIQDASEANVRRGLPAWFQQHVKAQAFLLLPLMLQGNALGLIYADMNDGERIALDEKGLALLKTLRNQAVMTLRQTQLR
ncbi:MAG: HDOD domain-containing protein [Curvibacter sp.]|nr:HDOD domain-containing protein [Curvibacter sp.]